MRISRLSLFMIAALGLVGAAVTPASANPKCKPTVTATNSKGIAIKVLRFKYKIGTATVYSEGLTNKTLSPGEKETWPSQTLGSASNGVVVSSTAVEYQDDTSGTGSNWGPTKTSEWFPHTFVCGPSHSYNQTVR